MVKNPSANGGDSGWTPRSGRFPELGNTNPLQYSCLKKSHRQRSLADYSPWGHKESDTTEWINNKLSLWIKASKWPVSLCCPQQQSSLCFRKLSNAVGLCHPGILWSLFRSESLYAWQHLHHTPRQSRTEHVREAGTSCLMILKAFWRECPLGTLARCSVWSKCVGHT